MAYSGVPRVRGERTLTTSVPDVAEFSARTEPYRRERVAHCYRMLGSVDEAEDLVQDTYLRAWRAYGSFEERASLRAWLYRIATNACLTALHSRRRRELPSAVVPPSPDLSSVAPAPGNAAWIEPIADDLVAPDSDDPATITAEHAGLRLAFIASLQYLPPRQRAVLLLRELLDWSAAEVAEALGISVAAVKSCLQRARARLDQVAPKPEDLREPTDAEVQAQLDTYMRAFETADIRGLERILRAEAVLETMPAPAWFAGREACLRVIAASLGAPGDWRMLPIRANSQPGAAAYFRGPDGVHHAFGIALLTVSTRGITCITLWSEPALVQRFGRPREIAATPRTL